MRVFGWFMGLLALGLLSIALFTYPAWLLLHPYFDFPFHRIGERIGMLALLVGFIIVSRRLNLADRVSLGYGSPRRVFLRDMSIGLVLGVLTMLAVVAIMAALGVLAWSATSQTLRPATGVALITARLASALTVAFIEESFLRGAMLTGIAREAGPKIAVLLTALLYAATHFLASYRIPAASVTATSGLDLLAGTVHLFADPASIVDAFVCLFAVGIVLGTVRIRTGNIAACVGLHAGWVWVMLVAHALSQPVWAARWSFLLSRFDGFVGWLVFAWTVLIGLALQRYYLKTRTPANRANRANRECP